MASAQMRRVRPKRKQQRRSNHQVATENAASHELALNPFYSFSRHWRYMTQQYICFTSWGTCMGGINEQYDNMLELEAYVISMEEKELLKSQIIGHHRSTKRVHFAKIKDANNSNANYKTSNTHYVHQSAPPPLPPAPTLTHSQVQQPKRKQFEQQPQNKAKALTIAVNDGSLEPLQPKSTKHDNETDAKTESKDENDEKRMNKGSLKPKHVKAAQSFERKQKLFTQRTIEYKRKRTIENEWEKRKRSVSKNEFQQPNDDGVKVIQQYAASPAAHSFKPVVRTELTFADYSTHMKSKEDSDAIVVDDPHATASVSDKVKRFQNQMAARRRHP